MKTWHVLAAIAWFSLFLGLARVAAGFREDPRATFAADVAFALVTTLLWIVTVPAALIGGDRLLAGCLRVAAATIAVAAAIEVFCWVGAGWGTEGGRSR